MVEILKKLTRAWQIGQRKQHHFRNGRKEPDRRRNSFLTSCFASLQDGRYAVWDAKSIHENFPSPGDLEPQRSARTKTLTRRGKSGANMATCPAGQRGKKVAATSGIRRGGGRRDTLRGSR